MLRGGESDAIRTLARPRQSRRLALVALLAAALLGDPGAAIADDAPPPAGQLTGDWNGLRPRLVASGLTPSLVYTGSMWSNVAGGIRTGTEFDGLLQLALTFDLGKLGLWRGLGFQSSANWFQGREPSEILVGVNVSQAVNGWEASNAIRAYELYLFQSFGDDGELQVGQLSVDGDFMASRYAGLFVNASFGDLPSQNLNLNTPTYPLAAPGVYLTSSLTSSLPSSLVGDVVGRVAAYTADAGDDVASNHGFGWALGNNAGYAFFAELACGFAPAARPGQLTLGGYYASLTAPKLDGTGVVHSLGSAWVMLDQALQVDTAGNPMVGVFARFSYSPPNGRAYAELYADAGLNVFGPIPGRPGDVLGLSGGVVRFTDDAIRAAASFDATPVGGEAVLELTYQIAATPWLVVQPDLQYVIDPVTTGRNATVIGLEVVTTF